MKDFSLVPVVGLALDWVPAALWLAFTGQTRKGLLVRGDLRIVDGSGGQIVRP